MQLKLYWWEQRWNFSKKLYKQKVNHFNLFNNQSEYYFSFIFMNKAQQSLNSQKSMNSTLNNTFYY
jgi:hypothetical protein